MCGEKGCVSNAVLVVLGIVFGAASALLWFFGPILFVRQMLPYALFFAVVIFIATAVMKARCGYILRMTPDRCHINQTCLSLNKYSPIILIAAAVFIAFALTVLASYFSLTVRVILAFIGSTSFWMMLFSSIAMIFCIFRRRC